MQNKDEKKFTRKQGAMLILSLCLVGAAAFTTFYTMNKADQEKEEQQKLVDLNEEARAEESETQAKKANTSKVEADLAKDASEKLATEMDVDPATLVNHDDQDTAQETEDAVDAAAAKVEANIQPSVSYEDSTPLTWPVAGTVVMDYSMDSTVYFATLDQYKYNPALIIGSEVGNQVVASAKGIVDSIQVNEETGTTLTLNLGNNYELVYGQLKETVVSEGDVVETGTLLGYVSEPTKYYCEEGSNLYFEMKKDGAPVDPFLYLE